MKKLISILVAFAMMATLCVAMAFAEDPNYEAEHFALTKELQMPDGTKTPAVTYTFDFDASTEASDHTATNTPAITDPTISYTANGSAANQTLDEDDIFTGTWAPGKYVYIITEHNDAATMNDNDETYTYDGAKYKVNMYVKADETKTFTIYKWNSETSSWEKTPITSEQGEDGVAEAKFTNTYVKKTLVNPNGDEEDPSNDSAGYAFEKFIESDAGGLYTDKEWAFDVTVDIPDLSSATGYTYEVWTVGTTGDNATAAKVTTKGGTIGEAGDTIYLKAGERAVFKDLDVGAKVNVKEQNTNDINESATLKVGDAQPASYAILTGADTAITQDVANYLKVTNTPENSTAPEGIMIQNLPFIVLALIAIGGLVAYVIVRRRNADEA